MEQVRMANVSRKIEIAANVAIVVVAVLVGVVAVKRFWPSGAEGPGISAGSRISIPGVDWQRNGESLVLALSPQCHFCSESAPFYQRLVKESEASGDARLVGLFPNQVEDGERYLASLGVRLPEVRRGPFPKLGIEATPTLLLVNQEGVVSHVWIGKLTPEKESEVLTQIKRHS
jgi:hypothetical protein